ncbi:MAG: FG-GAP repeat domain-containing protein [Planctomycetota bacterium]|jgi:hypothetical protein
MRYRPAFERSLISLGVILVGGAAHAQFSLDNSGNPTGPGIASFTENVDFADLDQDGDWDAVFADGGDAGNDQNRIWMNAGGAQGGTVGTFLDETSVRFPQQQDDSRDIEFADIDNDGDLDLYISNTAQIVVQGNKWWVNGTNGAGDLGYYTDETAARWINLGVNPDPTQPGGSSISPALVGQGTFIDWSCDCDFGDLDNDGDLDLVHSSYGGAFGGEVPTRLFLNDGDGRFEEFNPAGIQLAANTIGNGQPAIWAEGIQFANVNTTQGGGGGGTFADIASSALDIDIGDLDGDFDLDILHGARQEAPRLFRNRLEENGGVELPPFRDFTSQWFPSNYWSSADNYEQELGDLDGDGDLDIYGLNWDGFSDRTFRNDGNGFMSIIQTLSGSQADDNEGDFLDYDNDGDLDLFVANFSGSDKLYRNNGSGTLDGPVQSTPGGAASLDADAADIDADGDYDLIVAEDTGSANKTLINTTQVPDTHGPYIPNVENDGDRVAAAGVFPVRAQVYDNAPYYITWYNPTSTEVSVDGFTIADIPSMSSQGQIFRTEMPANLVGAVSYKFKSQDEYGNAGESSVQNYTASTPLAYATSFGVAEAGQGGTPSLDALSVAFAGSELFLGSQGMTAGVPYFLYLGSAALPAPVPIPGLATVNIAGPVLLGIEGLADAQGKVVAAFPIPDGFPSISLYFQLFALDGTGGKLLSSTAGLEVISQ